MKAYRTADGSVQLFRPDCNAKRFQDSADRLCIPKIPTEDFVQAVREVVKVDEDWVLQTAAERTRSNGTFGTGATESTTVPKVHPYQYHSFS
ncbi:MAG: hypothetical protein PUE44_09440, partial [Bulleidia sp.]|nr:hypothetical protein [Bulleidia sp.]